MATNDIDLIEKNLSKLNIENREINKLSIIRNENFKQLDNIVIYKQTYVLVADWGDRPGIHILDNDLNYLQKLELDLFINSMFVLINNNIGMICKPEDSNDENFKIKIFKISKAEKRLDFEEIKSVDILENKKKIRPYGLCQSETTNNLYFMDTFLKTRNILIYNENLDFISKKHIRLPTKFRKPGLRDLKIKGDFIFLTDHQFLDFREFGNRCIHIFDLNINYINSLEFNKSFNMNPVWLHIEPRPTKENIGENYQFYCCNWLKEGNIIFIDQNNEIIDGNQISFNYPFSSVKFGNKILITQTIPNSNYITLREKPMHFAGSELFFIILD